MRCFKFFFPYYIIKIWCLFYAYISVWSGHISSVQQPHLAGDCYSEGHSISNYEVLLSFLFVKCNKRELLIFVSFYNYNLKLLCFNYGNCFDRVVFTECWYAVTLHGCWGPASIPLVTLCPEVIGTGSHRGKWRFLQKERTSLLWDPHSCCLDRHCDK